MTKSKSKQPKIDSLEVVSGLFAFWRYDQFPYVLGAEVTRMDDKGNTYAPSYQSWFRPIKIMPTKAGKTLLAKIEQMRAEHTAARVLLDAESNKMLFDLLPEARNPEQTYAGFPRKVDNKK